MRVIKTIGDLADLLDEIEGMKFQSRFAHLSVRDSWFKKKEAEHALRVFEERLDAWRAEPLRIEIYG